MRSQVAGRETAASEVGTLASGLGIPQRLEAVLQLLPLDCYVESPAVVVELVPSDRERGLQTPVWTSYQSILSRAGCADLPEERTRGSRPGQQPHPDPQGSSDDSRAPGRRPPQPPVHLSAQPSQSPLATIETFEFYEWTRKAFAVVTTGEAALYGNLILKKGLPAPDALFQAC
ncbi:fucose mutarotase isoform X1 [Neophocaena asiaeorientalis asiaeorientalis]|uniref:L-fucose mutarotase n=1 Tax=Neophocaena asiaeorientalis asiaeorientalis TaxID=1706337 RepID=A0A341CU53_NEOAA|nr:fucose mutarotase isoform X1 [Neophocaena asiaeorientalis asiaeorientalis]